MKAREDIEPRSETRQRNIPARLVILAAPLVAVTVVVGAILVWALLAWGDSAGFSRFDVLAMSVAVVVAGVAIGTVIAARKIGQSMATRIGEVSAAARRVADRDLAELLDVLRNPEPDLSSITPMSLEVGPNDEIGDLARSLQALHGSLVEVAARQMEALRAGVSSIFVTLARRNSSLVDRQLALLDQLEAKEDDPEVLGGFYQLDHLATRMRRNAESLLVLAGSESPRVWARPTEITDVVRAAISEIDEYLRIEVVALDPARLSGGAVSDVSHLIAELLENAIQFSPPSEVIRVTGLFDLDGYQLSVSDRGLGMSESRAKEMNRILERPPALGLSVEPTLGMYVVAKLAHRHGLTVELIRGVPGVTAKVTIPRDHLEAAPETGPRPWDANHTARLVAERSGPPMAEVDFADPETKEYVYKRALESVGIDTDVVDLTAPRYADPGRADTTGDLPMRTPGSSFTDDEDGAASVSPGEGAARIRSALAAYDQGRRSAAGSGDVEPSAIWEDSSSEDSV
ncbi:MAG TPA: ATP-binding protein [Acidimicrobiia bacterium]|nr:ATP-binding protein [Acidimicrobiia bacterium]